MASPELRGSQSTTRGGLGCTTYPVSGCEGGVVFDVLYISTHQPKYMYMIRVETCMVTYV